MAGGSKGFQSSMALFNQMYEGLPYFTDIFDEESFYLFAICFVLFTILVVVLLSKFITLKEVDW